MIVGVRMMCAVGLAVGLGALPLQAQRHSVEVAGFVGFSAATRDLAKASDRTRLTAMRARLDEGPTLGAAGLFRLGERRARIRGSFRYGLGSSVTWEPALCTVVEGPVCDPRSSGASDWGAAVDVVIGGAGEDGAGMFFLVGAGLEHLDFADLGCAGDDFLCTITQDLLTTQNRPSVRFGVGAERDFGGTRAFVELLDIVAPYDGQDTPATSVEGEIGNTLTLSVGVLIPLR